MGTGDFTAKRLLTHFWSRMLPSTSPNRQAGSVLKVRLSRICLLAVTCPECGKETKGEVCRVCQARRTRAGMLVHQRRFLQTWLAGELQLRVKRVDGVLHLELFDDRWHSYCDIEMFGVTNREYVRELPADLCPACVQVFQGLVDEAKEVQ